MTYFIVGILVRYFVCAFSGFFDRFFFRPRYKEAHRHLGCESFEWFPQNFLTELV